MADMEVDSEEPSEGSLGWCLEPLTSPVSTPRGAGSEEELEEPNAVIVNVTMDMISGTVLHCCDYYTTERLSIGRFIGICKEALKVKEETISLLIGHRYFNRNDACARIMLLDVTQECIKRDGRLPIKVILRLDEP